MAAVHPGHQLLGALQKEEEEVPDFHETTFCASYHLDMKVSDHLFARTKQTNTYRHGSQKHNYVTHKCLSSELQNEDDTPKDLLPRFINVSWWHCQLFYDQPAVYKNNITQTLYVFSMLLES